MRIHIVFILAVSFLGLASLTTPALADTIPLNSLNLEGTSALLSPTGPLRLTPNYDTDPTSSVAPAGAAWTKSTYDIASPFSVNFQFQMSDPCIGNGQNGACISDLGHGGDGIAFVIQDSSSPGPYSTGSGDTALGQGAGGMGFLGINDSVAVMLDTYQNDAFNYYGDPSNNYISVNTRGTDFNVPHHFCTNGLLTTPESVHSDLPGALGDCTASPTLGMTGSGGVPALSEDIDSGVHDVEITYTGSMLDIYLDSALVLAVSIDLSTDLQTDNAFLGFTAGTRYAYQNQDILSFAVTPEPAWGQLWVPLAMILAAVLARKWRRSKV